MVTKRKLTIAHEYKLTAQGKEHVSGKSLTVPDESLSIREILTRFTRGQSVGGAKEPAFDSGADFDSPDLEKVRDMDLVDRDELRSRVLVKKSDLQKKVDDEAKSAKHKKQEEDNLLEQMKKDFKEKKSAAGPPDPGRVKERNDGKE